MRKIPFLRLTLFLVLGILLEDVISMSLMCVCFGLTISFISSIICFWISKSKHSWIGFFGFSILIMFFNLGFFASKIHDLQNDKNHYHVLLDGNSFIFQGQIETKDVGWRTKYLIAVENLTSLDSFENSYNVSGNLLLTSSLDTFIVGDRIQFKVNPNLVEANQNEFGFDYQRYCSNKQIYYRSFSDEISLVSQKVNFISKIRNSLISNLDELNILESTRSVLYAMLLGNKSRLGEVENTFRKTGTSHVLAISGLHVGIISALLFYVLSFLPRRLQWLKYLFTIIGIWLFCLVSGLAPSTVRACIMMTCFFVGKYFKAEGLGYNFVFLAAFFMLLKQPMLIYDIGFQFSFLAILGILYFFEPLSKVFVFKGIKNSLWQMLILSFCAQLLITPISLYYFHQFPILFALTSIIAIPSTFLIIALSLFTLTLSSIGLPINFLESLLDWFISLFLNLLDIFAGFDNLILKQLWPNELEVCLYYICLFSITIFFNSKNIKLLYTFLGSFSFLLIVQFSINFSLTKPELIIYADSKNIIIDVIQSGSCLTICEDGVREKSLEWIQSGQHTKSHIIKKENFVLSKFENHIFEFYDQQIYIMNSNTLPILDDVDILLLNTKVNVNSLCMTKKLTIIDFADNQKSDEIKSNFQYKKQF